MAKINLLNEARRLVRASIKNWAIVAACAVAVTALAGAYLYIKKPSAEVMAKLMLPPEASSGNVFSLGDLASSFSMGDIFGGSSTDNEIGLIRSHSVFDRVARDLDLNVSYFERLGFMKWMPAYGTSKLRLTADTHIADTISVGLLFDLKKVGADKFDILAKCDKKKIAELKGASLPASVSTPYGEFEISATEFYGQGDPIGKFRIIYGSYAGAAESYSQIVKAFAPNKKTDFIDLSYVATDPEFGKALLNSIINNYNVFANSLKTGMSENNLEFIDKRIETMAQEVAQAENSMEQFKQANNLTDPTVDAKVLVEKAGMLDGLILEAQTNVEVLKLTRDFLADPANKYELIPQMLSSGSKSGEAAPGGIDAYNALIMERIQAYAKVKKPNAAMKMLDEQIDQSRENVIATVDRAYENALVALKELQKENSATLGRMGTIPTIEKEYIGLERDLVLKQKLYLFLLKQKEEAEMSVSKVSPSLITVDPPYTPSGDLKLSKGKILAVGAFLGILLGLAMVYVLKLPSTPVYDMGSLRAMSKAPVLGCIAADRDGSDLPVMKDGGGASLRQLRAAVVPVLGECGGKVTLVTSVVPGEGKTFVASNLAMSLALCGYRALLIGADLRHPQLPELFGVAAGAPTLCSLVSGGAASLNREIWTANGLDVLPAGSDGRNPADVLGDPRIADVFKALREKYDYIVVDSASLKHCSDTYSLASVADLTLIVAATTIASPANMKFADTLVKDGVFPRIAIVGNSLS